MSTPSTSREAPDLWSFAWGQPQVDPERLALGIEAELRREDHDFRTRLLIRDGAKALENYWGREKWERWASDRGIRGPIEAIRLEELGRPGFDFSKERLVPATDPENVRRYLRELGVGLSEPAKIRLGGSIPLILSALISRATNDIDVVDEVPESIRSERRLLAELKSSYGLSLAHFASHYLPEGWSARTRFLGSFGKIHVDLVDPIDIFLSKLCSGRMKDREDLRALTTHFGREILLGRLASAKSLLAEDAIRQNAETNWYILFGESLPSGPTNGEAASAEGGDPGP